MFLSFFPFLSLSFSLFLFLLLSLSLYLPLHLLKASGDEAQRRRRLPLIGGRRIYRGIATWDFGVCSMAQDGTYS